MKSIVIIEDHQDYREIISDLFSASNEFAVSGSYGSVESALAEMEKTDVVLVDIGLPGKSGIEGLREIKLKFPETIVIMLTSMLDDEKVFDAISSGADGYLLKKTSGHRIIEAVKEAVDGGISITPFIARRMIETFNLRTKIRSAESELSPREKEVLSLMVQGMNYKKTAEKMFISPDTVKNHIRNIYSKLQVHSRSEAVAKAIHERLV